MTTCNVVVSAAGRRVALMEGLQTDMQALSLRGSLIAADMTQLCPAAQWSKDYEHVPSAREDGFADEVVRLCRRRDVTLLIPTIDTELDAYARIRDELASAGTLALVSGQETVRIASDKRTTYDWLRANGLPTVEQWDLTTAQKRARDLRYPVIAKPAQGSASVGVRRVDSALELLALRDDDLIVQLLAPGDEYTIDVWVDRDGQPRCAVPRKRLEVRNGEVSKGLTEARSDLISLAMELSTALPDPFGPLTFQVFASGGDVNVIEVNARFGGGFPLTWQAGARYTRWAIQDALGAPYRPEQFRWRDGLVMLRYDAAEYAHRSEVGV